MCDEAVLIMRVTINDCTYLPRMRSWMILTATLMIYRHFCAHSRSNGSSFLYEATLIVSGTIILTIWILFKLQNSTIGTSGSHHLILFDQLTTSLFHPILCSMSNCVEYWKQTVPFTSRLITGNSVVYLVVHWITDHYHLSSNLRVGISEGCFIFDFTSLPLEVTWHI